jgi:hypothetical protein
MHDLQQLIYKYQALDQFQSNDLWATISVQVEINNLTSVL